jgi:hypothetical protein
MTAAREEVGRYWYPDFSTKELRRKRPTGLSRVFDFFWKTRHTLWEFYWWLAFRRAQEDMMAFDNPIESDNMPIAGFPTKYELRGGWTIPSRDLRYLKGGPLVSEGLKEILVKPSTGWARVLELFRQVAPLASTLAAIATLVNYWPVLAGLIASLFGGL